MQFSTDMTSSFIIISNFHHLQANAAKDNEWKPVGSDGDIFILTDRQKPKPRVNQEKEIHLLANIFVQTLRLGFLMTSRR